MRLLTRWHPSRQPVGRYALPGDEVLRFRSHLSLSFPPSEIVHLQPAKQSAAPIDMTVAFLGLTGAEGALPRHYTELLIQRAQVNDHAFRHFLDLFNHRLISLFYRAWEKHHCVVGYERACETGEEDRFASLLYAVLGLGTGGMREQLDGDDGSLLRYAGLLVQRPRSAHALQHCLTDAFQVAVQVRQFVGAWLSVEAEDWSRVGTPGTNNRLGQTAVAGTRVWDQQAGFHVRLGPLDFVTFSRLLPSGEAFGTLVRMTKFVVGPEFDFRVNLMLKASEVPPCRLQVTPAYTPRLGWTTWLSSTPRRTNAEEVMFSGEFSTAQIDAA